MLELRDFFHLPQIDTILAQLVNDRPGLTIVAGLDPRSHGQPQADGGFRPGGRLTFFRILLRQLMEAHSLGQALIVTQDRDVIRIPRQLRRRIRLSLVQPPATYADYIADAARQRPGLLVIEHLSRATAAPALEAAQRGIRVLTQLDTIYRGPEAVRQLLDMDVPPELLQALRWIVAVGRQPVLCQRCKRPVSLDPIQLAALRGRYPDLDESLEAGTFCEAVGCPECRYTGRSGDVTVFDFFRMDAGAVGPLQGRSALPLEVYFAGLAAEGQLPLDDLFRIDSEQLRHTYNLLTSSEEALAEANAELQRKMAELEAANQVLRGRTEALISLEDIGQALITSAGLHDLGGRVCRHARDLCGADRAILYYVRPDERAEVLALSGWDPGRLRHEFELDEVFDDNLGTEAAPFNRWPPGMHPRHPDVEGVALRAGLRVPLMAQHQRVGLMIVHTTYKSTFTPGEVALLQTFANQAAIAIQRAGLIEQLQVKIAQLEAAQAELVEKERLEREMELARQVQQSVLPRIFPLVPGYTFGASNRPASQVGGDFYDVILLDGNRFAVVVADVSDKGMPAALYMALTRSLLLAEGRRGQAPVEVLTTVHRLLRELGQPDMFVTVFYGVVDGPAHRLIYARAGHDRPLLLRDGRVHSLSGEGTFLGFPDLDDLHLSEEHIDLYPGDRLVLYTDGLTDILSPEGRPYGLGRFQATLLSHAHLDPDELCDATFTDLEVYQAGVEQYDDMTMLVVEVK